MKVRDFLPIVLLSVTLHPGSGTAVTTVLDGIDLEPETYRRGEDYATLRVDSLRDCTLRCARAERCVALDYRARDRICRLKDRFAPVYAAQGMTSGGKRLWSGVRPNTREIEGVLLEYDSQRRGGDYYRVRTADAAECARTCAYQRRCRALDYDPGTRVCRLKNRVPSARGRGGAVSGINYGAEIGQRQRR